MLPDKLYRSADDPSESSGSPETSDSHHLSQNDSIGGGYSDSGDEVPMAIRFPRSHTPIVRIDPQLMDPRLLDPTYDVLQDEPVGRNR